jgi:hypothetical protein
MSCLRAENGQKLRCRTITVCLPPPSSLKPRCEAMRSRESVRSLNIWSPMWNSGS